MVEMKLAEQAAIPMELGSEILPVEVGNDRFWDAYQENGNRANYENAFAGYGWTDETFAPRYDITPTNAMGGNRMFYKTGITDLQKILDDRGLVLDTSKIALIQTFQNSKVVRVGTIDMRQCVYAGYAGSLFADSAIETIDKLSVRANVQFDNTIFKNCKNLKNLTVDGIIGKTGFNVQWSVDLSKDSIVSIIGALSATTNGLTVTLSATAVTNAFGSTSADRWTALVATKPNWTISLV